MPSFNRKDRFYIKAKNEGYPARSAYKIMEMDDQFNIFKSGSTVIDLGCAPGGWLKVGEERLGERGLLIGIDLLPLHYTPKPTTHFLMGDFTKPECQEWIKTKIPQGVDWVISDMAPNISGIKFKDHLLSYELCMMALDFSRDVLKPGGGFICKIFPGTEFESLKKNAKPFFSKIITTTPEATRKTSIEIYLICKGFIPKA